MIVKKIRNQNTPKPKAKQIADLVDYIRQPHNTNPAEKIEHSGGLNFLSGSHASQRMEMIALATETVYSKMPVSHYVFSWREYEQPTAEQVDELADIFLREMGLEGCQTVYGLHYNTDNYHVHIAVNRMHPMSMKVIDPNNGFDIEAAHKVLALVEHRQGWKPEANALYAVNEQGEAVRRKRKSGPKPKAPALDYETATGAKSAQRIAQERGHAIIQAAQSWPELHEKLAAVGLRFEQKGSGAIIFVGEIAVKASSVDRAFSLKKLEKRLGAFVSGDYPEERKLIAPEPVSSVNLEEWKQYHAETDRAASQIVVEDPTMGMLKARQQSERKNLPSRLAEHCRHSGIISSSDADSGQAGRCPRPILNIARHFQKLQHKEELRQLRRTTRKPSRRRPRFEIWLRVHDLHDKAEHWRYRQKLENIPPDLWEAPPLPEDQKYDPLKAYAAHRRVILASTPDMEPSRLDALIALYMRKNGFGREIISNAIAQCAPQAQPERTIRDWQRYAERATNFAFGVEGDVLLARSAAAKEKERQEQEKREAEARREETPQLRPRLRM